MAGLPNYAGIRIHRRARQTGTHVGLYNSRDAGIDGHKWATVCEDHGELVTHDSYAVAASWVSYPADWCSVCRDNRYGTTNPFGDDDGFEFLKEGAAA